MKVHVHQLGNMPGTKSAVNRKVRAIQAKKKRSKRPTVKSRQKITEDNKESTNNGRKLSERTESSQAETSVSENQYAGSEDGSNFEEEEEILGSDDDEQELPSDYKPGGYHPVRLGDMLHGRYHVVRKLGWGHFSTVWLCWDVTGKQFVALKIVKSASHYTETALDEIKLLKCVRDSDDADKYRERTVQLLDDFVISGVNGEHVCMVFEVLGHHLLKLIIRSNYQGIPLQNVKSIIRQVLEGLDYLHTKCKIIHTDIKPENVLLCVNEAHVMHLVSEAAEWQKSGLKLPGSFVSTAPKHMQQPDLSTLTKNQRKSLKKKAKKQAKRLEMMSELTEKWECENTVRPPAAPGAGGPANISALSLTEVNGTASSWLDCVSEKAAGEGECRSSPVSSLPVHAMTTPSAGDNHVNRDEHESKVNELPDSIPEPLSNPPLNGHSPDETNNDDKVPQIDVVSDTELNEFSDEMVVAGIEAGDHRAGESRASTMSRANESPASMPRAHESRSSQADPAVSVCDISVKLADLGNACWTYHHFTEDIQTRQYRALEVLLGAGYSTPADIWSTACMAFELATGDYLFEPHTGDQYSRDEDHIAHIVELLGDIPRKIVLSGKYSRDFFNKKGELRHITKLKRWALHDVLMEKYEWPESEADAFASFLLPMMTFDPERRATAAQCLQHEWLNS